jgi:sialic acid synthase
MFNKKDSNEEPFIIAEVGQNHQGDLDKAREFIRVFSFEGADAIKFQTRNNNKLFSKEAYDAPYDSENSFANSYGAHREKLELKPEWLPILKDDCRKYGVKFMSTPFEESSLHLLSEIGVDILKIASFDLGNIPFINRIAKLKIPVVMSVGGGNTEQIRSSVEALLQHNVEIAILHCVSEYPCEYSRLGFDNIEKLIKNFPRCVVGSSDHFNGISSGPIAYMKGARVFEKHVTLNRSWKGTDHSFALEPEGFRRFARDTRRVQHMMKAKPNEDLGNEFVFQKLGKSIVAYNDIEKGEELTVDNLSGKIFSTQYIPVRESNQVIGKSASKVITKGEPILYQDLKD